MRFKNHDYAEFYDRQQTESGYPGELLTPVISSLEGFASVIDIGAGTGFFTIPLLESGHIVTAVEPAKEMSELILRKCAPAQRNRLSIINDNWENWNGAEHDASICIHSLYPMNDSSKAIELMYKYTERRIIIVREPSEMKTLSGVIRSELGLSLNRDFKEEIRSVLDNLGADFIIRKIREERQHRIKSIEHETESILYQLKLDDSFKTTVAGIIKELCSEDSSGLYFTAIYSDNMFIF